MEELKKGQASGAKYSGNDNEHEKILIDLSCI
jgi:hypothetical protein